MMQTATETARLQNAPSLGGGFIQGIYEGRGRRPPTRFTRARPSANPEGKARHELKDMVNRGQFFIVRTVAPVDYEAQTDDSLVGLAKEGDMLAFEELVSRHRDKVYGRAFSMVPNEEHALDLSQEAWIKAWQRLAQFNGDAKFATWITRITINLCLDYLRKAKGNPTDSVEEMAESAGGIERLMPVVRVNPTARLEREELRAKIDRALTRLSEDHRAVLVLHEFEEMQCKDVAKVMGCSIGTVMSRLFYARRKMAAILSKSLAEE